MDDYAALGRMADNFEDARAAADAAAGEWLEVEACLLYTSDAADDTR